MIIVPLVTTTLPLKMKTWLRRSPELDWSASTVSSL
jgi:hypothetical protein